MEMIVVFGKLYLVSKIDSGWEVNQILIKTHTSALPSVGKTGG